MTRSLIKEPKIYLWDWSDVLDKGQRNENFVAAHLLKAIHLWTDLGLDIYGLYFLRDKEKNEVDFLVTRDEKPWFLVEVKSNDGAHLNPSLAKFQTQIGATHAFQVSIEMDYIETDCFSYHHPIIVPARTLLSQLV